MFNRKGGEKACRSCWSHLDPVLEMSYAHGDSLGDKESSVSVDAFYHKLPNNKQIHITTLLRSLTSPCVSWTERREIKCMPPLMILTEIGSPSPPPSSHGRTGHWTSPYMESTDAFNGGVGSHPGHDNSPYSYMCGGVPDTSYFPPGTPYPPKISPITSPIISPKEKILGTTRSISTNSPTIGGSASTHCHSK